MTALAGAALVDVAHRAVSGVVDPEIPTVTIAELGILRGVTMEAGTIVVTITPTYSGCPAMAAIRRDVELALAGAGISPAEVRTALAPAWTTEWVTDEGRRKLEASGIAPPGDAPRCPRCRTDHTRIVSEFGSTACKALSVCSSCGEPFDVFKDL